MPIDEAIYREASEPLQRYLKIVVVYTVMAAALAAAVPFAYVMGGSGYSQSTMGRVVHVQKLRNEARRIYTIEFPGPDGELRSTREGERSDKPLEMGDEVVVLFNLDDDVARSANVAERGLRIGFIALSASLMALNALFIVLGLLDRRRRRWLLSHGRIEQGQDPRVTWHTIAILPQLPPTWRLSAAWFDADTATWRRVTSTRQAPMAWEPRPDAQFMHIYVDPKRPGRSWLPVAHHRVTAPKG